MPRTGRPALTETLVQRRIAEYCARYDCQELNADGFPAYPTGRRETAQHREWISLYRAFRRTRARAASKKSGGPDVAACPVCLRPSDRPDQATHPKCRRLVELVRELGPGGLERIRSLAFPDDSGAVSRPTRQT